MAKKTLVKEIEDLQNIPTVPAPTASATSIGESTLYWVIKSAITYHETYIFPRKVEIIKFKYLDAIDRYFQLKKMWMQHRSNRVFPLIASIHDTFTTNLYEVDINPRAIARTSKDQEATEMAQDFFDWAKETSELEFKEWPIWSESTLIWTSYWRSGFSSDKTTVEYMKKWQVKTNTFTVNEPTVEHVSFFQLFYDCHWSDFYATPWKAYRYIDSFKSVAKKYSFLWKIDDWLTNHKIEILKWWYFSNMDYTRIYNSKNYENEMCKVKTQKDYDDWTQRKIFEINYSENELVEVVEYWEDERLVLFINSKIYYDGISPYPFNSDPFHVIVHEAVPWSIHWIWIGDKLIELQKQVNNVFCSIEDAIRMHMFPMYRVTKWALKDAKWLTPKKITYIPEWVLEDATPTSNWWIDTIRFVDFNLISVAKQYLSELIAQAYEVSWVNSYTQWWQGKVERSAAGIAQRTAVTRTRLQPIIASLNKFHSRLFNQRLAIAVTMFDDEFDFRIIWDDGREVRKSIDLESILNKFDVVAESEANRLATKELRSSQAINALSQINALNIDPVTQLPIYDVQPLLQMVFDRLDFPWLVPITTEQYKTKIAMLNELKWQPPVEQQSPIPEEVQQQIAQQQAPIPAPAPAYWTMTDQDQLNALMRQAYQS